MFYRSEEGEKALALARHRFTPYTGTMDFMNVSRVDLKSSSSDRDLPKTENEVRFQAEMGSAMKRPRGRPRKYPLMPDKGTSSQNVNPNNGGNYSKSSLTVKQSIENFARAYASTLQMQAAHASNPSKSSEFVSGTSDSYPLLFDLEDCYTEDEHDSGFKLLQDDAIDSTSTINFQDNVLLFNN